MEKILGILGIILCIGFAYLCSNKKEEINWKSVTYAFLSQLVIAFIFIKTPVWKLVEWLGNGISWVIFQANEGINFVFGGVVPSGGFVFFINSLLPIVFVSSIMGALFHFGVIQKFVGGVGKIVAKTLNVDSLVAVNGVTNMFLGQTDALFITKAYLPKANEKVIFATMVGGMTSISVSVLGLYHSYGADMTWLIVSLPLSVCSTFVLTQILMPTSYSDVNKIEIDNGDRGVNVIETMMNYAQAGFKSCIGISIALMVFLSVVALINGTIGLFCDWLTIQAILGCIFKPLAFLMGVPMVDVTKVSQLLAMKLATNEVVAYGMPQFNMLSANAKAMLTVALAGFTGVGSIGILIGGYSAVAPNQVKVVAKLGVKALITATFVTMMTGTIVGLML